MPLHVGVIMDGNGRWAVRRGLPREAGHRAGARTVEAITEAAAQLGLRQLTLFAFSSENWARPPREVALLMALFARYLASEQPRLLENNIRLRAIGRIAQLPRRVQRELGQTMRETRDCSGMTLCLAVNYGARNELLDAFHGLASDLAAGRLDQSQIDESAVASRLYQPDMPPLDLIIRTGGEMRLSNFLLWQAAYAEMWFTQTLWPDFTEEELKRALAEFNGRARRFGKVAAGPSSPLEAVAAHPAIAPEEG
jgi:undecaprenyl diphosphate synthase